jgi:hypothetical protein
MPDLSKIPPRVRAIIIAVIVTALGGTGTVVVTTTDSPPTATTAPAITVPVDGLDVGKAPDSTIKAPVAVVQKATPLVEDDLANEMPSAASPDELKAAKAAAEKITATQAPLSTAGATAGFNGCRTSFVRNQSSRNGVRPTEQTLHYTVSGNRPGWSDINAIVALFDRASFAASSNFVIDAEGNCAYIVPIEAKAWTQAAGNPFSVSYEIIATGSEGVYLPPVGMAKLRAVVREVARRTGIPLRRGLVRGCAPVRSGIIDHAIWGQCGGGHTDIKPFDVDAIVKGLAGGTVTAADRATCRKINAWRDAGRPAGGGWAKRTIKRRQALEKRHVTCLAAGPVKA